MFIESQSHLQVNVLSHATSQLTHEKYTRHLFSKLDESHASHVCFSKVWPPRLWPRGYFCAAHGNQPVPNAHHTFNAIEKRRCPNVTHRDENLSSKCSAAEREVHSSRALRGVCIVHVWAIKRPVLLNECSVEQEISGTFVDVFKFGKPFYSQFRLLRSK